MTTVKLVTDHMRRIMALEPDYIGSWMTLQYAGSTAHGTYVHKDDPQHIDDVDIIGVFLPTERGLLGLTTAEHWMKPPADDATVPDGELDIVTYEIRKWAKLLLKGNPNVLGTLWSPHVQMYTNVPLWKPWVENRELFLSRQCYDSFSGYAYAQLMKLGKPNTRGYMGRERKQLFAEYGYDIKNAAHCIRLLRMGVELFETGELHVDRTNIDAAEIKEIKSGKWTLSQVQRAAEAGFDRLHPFKENCPFPPRPDFNRVERLVVDTLKRSLDGGHLPM